MANVEYIDAAANRDSFMEETPPSLPNKQQPPTFGIRTEA